MKLAITILIIFSLSSFAQSQKDSLIVLSTGDTLEAVKPNCYSIDQYLLNYGNVVYAEVLKIKENKIRIKIIDNIKRRKKWWLSKKTTVHLSDNVFSPVEVDSALTKHSKHIFILGNTRWKMSKLILRNPMNRFIVQNDSLFIPYQVLGCITFPKDINIYSKNTFNDPLQTHGYTISLKDFQLLCETLYGRYEKEKNGLRKIDNEITVENPFIHAVLMHLDSVYESIEQINTGNLE